MSDAIDWKPTMTEQRDTPDSPRPAHGAVIPKPPSLEDRRDVSRQQGLLDDEWAPTESPDQRAAGGDAAPPS